MNARCSALLWASMVISFSFTALFFTLLVFWGIVVTVKLIPYDISDIGSIIVKVSIALLVWGLCGMVLMVILRCVDSDNTWKKPMELMKELCHSEC